MSQVKLVVDAMGGDDAPDVVLEGVEQALLEDPEIFVYLTGPAKTVVPFAEGHERCEAVPAEEVIGMGEHPANAVRKKKDSSIVVGCRLVKEGKAAGFYSAGSTGAFCAAPCNRLLISGRLAPSSRSSCTTYKSAISSTL